MQKKVGKTNVENDKNKTAEQVQLETATRIKSEIKNIIDDIVKNSGDGDDFEYWLIQLNVEFKDNYNDIIAILKKIIKDAENNANPVIKLSEIKELDQNFKDVISRKFEGLKEEIIKRIEKLEGEAMSSFTFEFDIDSIKPILSTVSGPKVIEAIGTLLKLRDKLNASVWSAYSNTGTAVLKDIDLFKVSADLNYKFSFSNITTSYDDKYSDCDLLLTGEMTEWRKIKQLTNETIQTIIQSDKKLSKIEVYNGNKYSNDEKDIQSEFNYLGKKMDWDFTKTEVKNEIKDAQFKRLTDSKNLEEIKSELKFNQNEIKYIPLNQMKFNNFDLQTKRDQEDCVLVCGRKVVSSSSVVKKILDQYGIEKNKDEEYDIPLKNWTEGKLNKSFFEKLKNDYEQKVIDSSEYYGVGEKAVGDSNFLVGYGKTVINGLYYAKIPMSKISFTTAFYTSYDPEGMKKLYNEFVQYVQTIVAAVLNEQGEEGKNLGVIIRKWNYPDFGKYMLQWRFGYDDEVKAIREAIDNSKNGGKISFDWIMHNILLKKRIEEVNHGNYKLPENLLISDEAKTSLKTDNEINYVLEEKGGKNELIAAGQENIEAHAYIKYGPFVFYLTDKEVRAIWRNNEKNVGILPKWGGKVLN